MSPLLLLLVGCRLGDGRHHVVASILMWLLWLDGQKSIGVLSFNVELPSTGGFRGSSFKNSMC
jgi:hypothetical protein